MCSTHTIVMPSSPRIRRSISAASCISVGSSPPRLSSARSRLGRVASARASSSFLSPPAPSVEVVAWGSVGRPTRVRISRAWRRASASVLRSAAPKWAATATFSRMVSLRNGRGIWNVRASPRWQTASGVRPAMLVLLEADGARGGQERAGDAVEAGRLAGAVGPDEAQDLARPDLEGDRVQRGEAAELLGEPVDREHAGSRRGGGRSTPASRDRDLAQRAAQGDEAGRRTGGLGVAMTAGHT